MDRPRTRFARFGEDRIAYQVVGDGAIDLVMTIGSACNVDMLWDDARFSELYRRLATFSRLILFDPRGAGSSDPLRVGEEFAWESWTDDVIAVMDAAGSERAALVGALDASPAAILCAATRPERIQALIVFNGTARIHADEEYPIGHSAEVAEAVVETVIKVWGTPEAAPLFHTERRDDHEFAEWYARYLRSAATPRRVREHIRRVIDLDVRAALPTISVPTLVVHRRDNLLIPIAMGHWIADHVPGAQFVELPGSIGLTDGHVERAVDVIRGFLTGDAPPAADASRVLSTVLFSDVVDSTGLAVELGDRRWTELLERHDLLVKQTVAEHRGKTVSSTGDGVLATFDAPTKAVRSAFALRAALADVGLPIRVGLHTGEVELRDGGVGGIGVHIAARVVREACSGEVLCTRTVRDLATGADLEFQPRGETALKGVPEKWELFSVQPAGAATP
jgi:class 3 adenylate cyclase/pimeloyl-ACP methyl ester carboxylesterase